MKYIKTEDGRIVDVNAFAENAKQGNTIEELCDEFVVVARKGEGEHAFVADSKRIATWNASLGEKVYGAIWTNEGLKYVAKMNKSGELELL